jgi:DNA polymerase I-like protein with 3'-5' exonuclease and polymerase domains
MKLSKKFYMVGTPYFTPIKITKRMAIDTETTGLDPWGKMGVDREVWPARPFMIQYCNEDGETGSIRWQVDAWTRRVFPSQESFDWLASWLSDDNIGKVWFNGQFDRRMLELSGLKVRGRMDDALIAVHTVTPMELTYQLKPLCKKFLQISDDDQKALERSTVEARRKVHPHINAKAKDKPYDPDIAKFKIAEETKADFWLADEDLCRMYGELDALRTMQLFLTAEHELSSPGNEKLKDIYNMEMELMDVLDGMERRGVRIDIDRMKEVQSYYQEIVEKYSSILEEEATGLNPNSPKQLQLEFFRKRKYKPITYSFDKAKNKHPACIHCKGLGCDICQNTGKNPKCDADFFSTIATKTVLDDAGNESLVENDRLANAILYLSAADTMLGYIKQYDQFKCYENGVWVLHPNYKQSGTKTGRLSAEQPNTQNVASDDSGKKRCNIQYRCREIFIPRPGYKFYIPDYSQIEVWLLFLRAGAGKVVSMLAKGGDAHQIVSNFVWGHLYDATKAKACEDKDPKTLTPDEKKNLKTYKQSRKKAKNLQFCKIYGGGKAKIASMIGCKIQEAEAFINDYDERLPEVAGFMSDKVKQAKREGTTENAYGRRYIIDPNFAYRATNYDIQGSAADLIKRAMIYVNRLCLEKYRGKVSMLLSIHDELMIEVKDEVDSNKTRKDIAEAMGRDYTIFNCPISFPVGMKIAKERWSESLEIKL